MKKSLLLLCLFGIVITTTTFAQMDTSDRPLAREIIANKFFLQTVDKKIEILDKLRTDIPEPDSGKIAESYDMLRTDIALTYGKTGDETACTAWMAKVRTTSGKIRSYFRLGEQLLTQNEKGNAARVEAMLRPTVDSVNKLYQKNSMALQVYNGLMPIYVQALLALNQPDKIAYHLGLLYEANKHTFPTDARLRAVIKPENYKITQNLMYDYGMALAATGRHKEALAILAHLYLSGELVSEQIQANIKAETEKMPGGTAYYQHLTDSIHQFNNNKLNAFAAAKKDINGQPVNFATLKGKYVLLDFWGSWCRPCRASHPHLKELYSKYKDKGFEIIGIAMEHATTPEARYKAWTDAVQADGLTWLQVLNNEQLEQFDAVKEFDVTAFPTKILLDRDGNIIGRYVGNGSGGSAFGERLATLLGN